MRLCILSVHFATTKWVDKTSFIEPHLPHFHDTWIREKAFLTRLLAPNIVYRLCLILVRDLVDGLLVPSIDDGRQ